MVHLHIYTYIYSPNFLFKAVYDSCIAIIPIKIVKYSS